MLIQCQRHVPGAKGPFSVTADRSNQRIDRTMFHDPCWPRPRVPFSGYFGAFCRVDLACTLACKGFPNILRSSLAASSSYSLAQSEREARCGSRIRRHLISRLPGFRTTSPGAYTLCREEAMDRLRPEWVNRYRVELASGPAVAAVPRKQKRARYCNMP
jgi:hypothetical protein